MPLRPLTNGEVEYWYENSGYDMPYDEHIIVYGADIYSLKTGEALDLSALCAAARRRPETVYYPEPSLDTLENCHGHDDFGPEPTLIPDIKGYQAPEAVAALDAWLLWRWDDARENLESWVVLRFETPKGEGMCLATPFAVLEDLGAGEYSDH
ncbi:MAG: hypothetical protein GX580_16010 [Candidatus Hydrogenedens sp.]|nr:hypothetical protein [Candidatus Hydrogenedens sp.]